MLNDWTRTGTRLRAAAPHRRVAAGTRGIRSTALLLTAVAVIGCDLTVSNPGPVTDEFLNDELAQPALVNSVGLAFLAAFNRVAYQQMVVTREVHFAGQTGAHGFDFDAHLGYLDPENVNVQWDNSQRARWVADDAVGRLRTVLSDGFSTNVNAARALLWQGYAYRLLGENWCHAVIDGGAPEPGIVFLARAETALTEAIQVARSAGDPEVATAARAARASVRIWLDDWEGAVSDADSIPTEFVFEIQTSGLTDDQHNRVYWGSSNNPWRAHSAWNTFYEDYYAETGDPRTPWDTDPEFPYGNAEVTGIGQVPWLFQTKYDAQDDPYPLSKGTEMRLIEAEDLIRSGLWQEAMDIINDLRAGLVSDHDGLPIPQLVATTEMEAWTHLKRERGIVLWLEGRRLGDLRRWVQAGTPGVSDDMTGRSLCYPIPQSERERNPKVPLDYPEAPTG